MLGAHLRGLREAAGLTQSTISEVLGVSQPTVAGWESDRISMKATALGGYLDAVRASESDRLRALEAASAHDSIPLKGEDDATDPGAPSPTISGCYSCQNFARGGRCVVQEARPKVASWRANYGKTSARGAVIDDGCPGYTVQDDPTEETTAPPADGAS